MNLRQEETKINLPWKSFNQRKHLTTIYTFTMLLFAILLMGLGPGPSACGGAFQYNIMFIVSLADIIWIFNFSYFLRSVPYMHIIIFHGFKIQQSTLTFKPPVDWSAWQSNGQALASALSRKFPSASACCPGRTKAPRTASKRKPSFAASYGELSCSGVKWNGRLGEHININIIYWKVKNYWRMNYDTYWQLFEFTCALHWWHSVSHR